MSSRTLTLTDPIYEYLLSVGSREGTVLKPDGLIAVDSVLWSGQVADPQANDKNTLALKAFNQSLHQDQRITLSLLPIGDGLTLAYKKP